MGVGCVLNLFTSSSEMENEVIKYKMLRGLRKNSTLLYIEEYKKLYTFKTQYIANKIPKKWFTCYIKNCPASIIIEKISGKVVSCDENCMQANHPHQESMFKKMEIKNNIKEKCSKITLKRNSIREVYEEECAKTREPLLMPSYSKKWISLHRLKNEVLPRAPKSPCEY